MNGQGRKGGRPIHRGCQSITPSNIGLWKQTIPKQSKQVQGKDLDTTSRGGGGVVMVWVTD
ncbi:hypothetical protein TP2_10685 [Thioclava pacifica DSM 10166]|uniref:Uncharacterized protein n=1 Tax=Thioclava pacifica DSM 10166 TaxID=1353537 RepID=A0A074J3B2_9RHOB|nr:hypothetical protein TP2_10685 [Thioclava pacifica DSM 10166]